jgi:FixJ family two-component response regulator
MISPAPEQQVVHIVDDDDSFRKAVTRVLEAAGYHVCSYRSAGDFVLASRNTRPRGCLLLDLRLPGPSGLELQEVLAREEESMGVIFLTGYADVPSSVRAMKRGAVDFLTKPAKREELLSAVRAALARSMRLEVDQEHRAGLKHRLEKLTAREREVFDLVVAGKLNKQVAAELGMAERTVKAHRAQVMQKMEAKSLAELVHLADELRSEEMSQGASTRQLPLK